MFLGTVICQLATYGVQTDGLFLNPCVLLWHVPVSIWLFAIGKVLAISTMNFWIFEGLVLELKACHEHVLNVHYIVKCKCAILKEQAEQQAKCKLNYYHCVLLTLYHTVDKSTRMPKSNGSVVGPGIPSVIPRFTPHGDMSTPLLDPPTLYSR